MYISPMSRRFIRLPSRKHPPAHSCTSRAARRRWPKSRRPSRPDLVSALHNPGPPSRRSPPGVGTWQCSRSAQTAVCAAKPRPISAGHLPSGQSRGGSPANSLRTGIASHRVASGGAHDGAATGVCQLFRDAINGKFDDPTDAWLRYGEAVMMNTAHAATADAFARAPLPKRFCNLDRLRHAMKARGLDGIVATTPWNVFYLTGFNGIAHKSDEPRPYALIFSRHAPEQPILVLADYYLATFLMQPTWVEDLRPFRAVMMPLDLPAERDDIDRFIPRHGAGTPWIERARKNYAFDMTSAVRGALADLELAHGRVAFDDMGFGVRLEVYTLSLHDASPEFRLFQQ